MNNDNNKYVSLVKVQKRKKEEAYKNKQFILFVFISFQKAFLKYKCNFIDDSFKITLNLLSIT